jgi:outer membrane murein-binding lipoprotein Lpp
VELSIEMIVSIGALFASVITSFVVTKSKVSQLESELKEAQTRLAQLDARLDRNDTQTDLVGQRLAVISGMMDPHNRERLHRELERMKAEVAHLRRDVDAHRSEYLSAHNGRHPPIDGVAHD